MPNEEKIAIVGMGCRMPGASSPAAYWQNLLDGVESIEDLTDPQLLAAGVPAEDLQSPGYVKRAPLLRDAAAFDAFFFGFTPTDASIADPQQRIFLEVCRDALDDSGLTLVAKRVRTGVFATSGGSVSSYLLGLARAMGNSRSLSTGASIHLGNDKDFISTRASFKLDLRGPSLNVQTACSSSMVALHLACQSLLHDDCDLALAGASCVRVPQVVGYHSSADAILSKDGRCRPFDAHATGTLFGSGAGAVVLRRYSDAERDGDNIYAVILATSLNNDGGQKVAYTASSVPGQRACIEEALRKAAVSAREIHYVECHGTATKIGDPLEIKSLTQAFRKSTDEKGYCAIGSVKGNIGHLEQAAGMAGLIKTALMLRYGKIVPSIHCEQVNPKINLDESPFYVARTAESWQPASSGAPRIAGLNCLGMGGTNAFAVLSEPPARAASKKAAATPSLFCISAKTREALLEYAARFARFLAEQPADHGIADMAYTATTSRTEFAQRLALVATDGGDLAAKLERVVAQAEGALPTRRLPLAYVCGGERDQAAREPASWVLEHAPDEVRTQHRETRANIEAVVSGYARHCTGRSLDLLREAAAIFECELLLHGWLKHYGALVDEYHGVGVGAMIAASLRDEASLSASLSTICQAATAWTAPHPSDASLFGSFARYFGETHDLKASTFDGRQHCVVSSMTDASAFPNRITLADYARGGDMGLARLMGELYAVGVDVRWDRYYQGREHARVSLPTYPYQRKTYWFTDIIKETGHVGRAPDAS